MLKVLTSVILIVSVSVFKTVVTNIYALGRIEKNSWFIILPAHLFMPQTIPFNLWNSRVVDLKANFLCKDSLFL